MFHPNFENLVIMAAEKSVREIGENEKMDKQRERKAEGGVAMLSYKIQPVIPYVGTKFRILLLEKFLRNL